MKPLGYNLAAILAAELAAHITAFPIDTQQNTLFSNISSYYSAQKPRQIELLQFNLLPLNYDICPDLCLLHLRVCMWEA